MPGECAAPRRWSGSPGNMILVHVACTQEHGAPQKCMEAYIAVNLLGRLPPPATEQAMGLAAVPEL